MRKYTVLFSLPCWLLAGELLKNGDFESRLDTTWNIYAHGETHTIVTNKFFDADSDDEVYIRQFDSKLSAIYQTCGIPGTDLEFSMDARLFAASYSAMHPHPAVSAIILSYLDNDEAVLGETRIFYYAESLDWQASPTVHLIQIGDTNWFSYRTRIAEELQNLPGVAPAQVCQIRVVLYAYAGGC
jgi:hypothetical protein